MGQRGVAASSYLGVELLGGPLLALDLDVLVLGGGGLIWFLGRAGPRSYPEG